MPNRNGAKIECQCRKQINNVIILMQALVSDVLWSAKIVCYGNFFMRGSLPITTHIAWHLKIFFGLTNIFAFAQTLSWLTLYILSRNNLHWKFMPPQITPRLLFIDDSPLDIHILSDIARQYGWSYSVALNGKEGFHKALMSHYDLILLDVRMAGLDGFGTCRLLKAHAKTCNIPVIFLSVADDQENRLEGLQVGAVDYIVKTYSNKLEIAARIAIHLKINGKTKNNNDELTTPNAAPWTMILFKAAKEILLHNHVSPPEIKDLARKLGTSEKKLNQVFLKHCGLSPSAWLREERMCIARQILADTNTPIRDLAQDLGFIYAQSFSTAFRKRFKMTPRAFRQSLLRPDLSVSADD
ncbi:MAG: DNA-binding response regulator [Betaproteobacteria bacterium]